MSHGKFGTAINCMDGRVQLPVTDWMKRQLHLDYIDMITEPGPDKVVAGGQSTEIETIKTKAIISAKAHGSKIIVIAGHDDCAGNPVDKAQHCAQIQKSVRVIHSWNLPFDKVIGLWINKDWDIEIIDSFEK